MKDMVREIITDNRLKNPTFYANMDSKSLEIGKDLCDTLKDAWRQGRICMSISANQIGENERIIAIADKIGGKILVFYNPKILPIREEWDFWEDNLSRPGEMFKVKRVCEISVSYQTPDRKVTGVHYYGQMAALLQQEVDNLNGILPEERAISFVDVEIKNKGSLSLEK